ncbi:hypothetical protein [Hyphococcus sp.]|uniref:hypothetical protein n=1 Tax=Hyphococcus sp. TaxID=2038636 RepID=UPI003CCC1516
MDTIEFLLIVAVFAVVIAWYLQNAEAGSEGLIGLLAVNDDPESAKTKNRRAYRIKERAAHGKASMRDIRAEKNQKAAYRVKGGAENADPERMRQRFRRQDEARYRVKDTAANYKPKNTPGNAD